MPARTPQEVPRLFAEAFGVGNLEAIMELYEPHATLVAQPGQVVTGTEAIREVVGAFLAMEPKYDFEVRKVFEADDLALLFADWTINGTDPDGNAIEMSGQTTDVVRRQPDGSWLFVIDNPFGHGSL
jgi:uncharacterized protein (TIGR02246 family)